MKKIFKKIMIGVMTLTFVISCSSLTAQEYFAQGRYIDALKATAKELNENKKPLTVQDENEIAYRIKQVENVYEDKLASSYDDKSKATSYLELWEMSHIIEMNPSLARFNGYSTNRYRNAYELLSNAQKHIIKYVEIDPTNRVDALLPFINKLSSYGATRTQYNSIYETLARRAADIYIDIARNYEYANKYETAANYYYKAAEVYGDFGSNYRGSYDKYVNIKKALELSIADTSYNDAVREFQSGRYDSAKVKFEEARKIYSSYSLISQVSRIDSYLNTIKQSLEISSADTYFNEGVIYYQKGDYSRAKEKLETARKLYIKYGNAFKVNQVDSYLSTLGRTSDLNTAKKYYEEALRYYQRGEYSYAKEKFESSKQIYSRYGMNYEVNSINFYLETIKSINVKPKNSTAFENFYNNGVKYQTVGEQQKDYTSRAYYYRMAINEYKNAMPNTNDRNKIFELNERIEALEAFIKLYAR
ncbi:tetratricopeptide repeat protein [Pseudostreptobacillus hongkongensis]|uniref:tetratricopeptide repeat protein n=1 Tax=Pseudostreptobacillus hongkongensis TaxID=1162717 RepID=UPI0028D394ED|nr:tetratricopeptide repeat protein [Pseudostreptobacillus hongkongensis]